MSDEKIGKVSFLDHFAELRSRLIKSVSYAEYCNQKYTMIILNNKNIKEPMIEECNKLFCKYCYIQRGSDQVHWEFDDL